MGPYFHFFFKSHHPFHERYLKVYPISYLKFKVPLSIVDIRFFLTLGCLQPISNKFDFLNNLINKLKDEKGNLRHFKPPKWRPTSSPINCLKCSHDNT